MAKKDDEDISVQLTDDDTISVNIEDNPELQEAVTQEPKTTKEPKTKRVTIQEPKGPTAEEALLQAQAYGKEQEEARRAAEATANNERMMREQAQRDAAQAQKDAEQSRERASNSELAVIENGITAATQQVESLQEEFTRAAEAGEFAKMGQIQTKLSKAAAALDRLENTKATFDVTSRQTTEGRVETPHEQVNAVERYLSQMGPAAQNWLRQHPECMPVNIGGDSVKNNMMMAGHHAAVAKNIVQGSPEYFKIIEQHINPVQQQESLQEGVTSKAAEVQVAGTKSPKHIQPSAPPSRDNQGSGAPRSIREVRLTKDQQEMAKVSFPHLPEAQAYGQYARNLIELEAEGKLGRTSH